MSEHDRREAAADPDLMTEFHVGDRVMTREGFPGVIDAINDGAGSSLTYFITLDNGMGGGEYGEGEISALRQTSSSVERTASDDYPELGDILSVRPPLTHAIPASDYFGGRVLAKTADLYFDTPASDALYEEASYVASTASAAMGHLVTAIDDWEDLRTRFVCAACAWQGALEPLSVLGVKVDVCPGCGHQATYEPVQDVGWPVAARKQVVALWLPPTTDAPQIPGSDEPGWQDGYRDALAGADRQPKSAEAEYVAGYHDGWAQGVKNHTSAPEIGLTTPDDLGPSTAGAVTDFIKGRPPAGQETGYNWSYDWCRYRRSSHCWYPKTLNERATEEAGYQIWNPIDRGFCNRITWDEQKACPAPSEPGPHVPGGMPDATIPWDQGGQRMSSLAEVIAERDPLVLEPDFRFHLTSAWKDVREKAKRIRAEGGVRILSVRDNVVVAQVKGDSNVYQTGLVRMPGSRTSVADWECGCPWAAYSWGRSGRWKRFEGRMCSHALATQYEVQARGMFGKEVHEDTKQPSWMDPTIPVRQHGDYDKAKARHSGLRPVEAFDDESPAMLFAADLLSEGGSVPDAVALLVGLGVRNAPLVVQAAAEPSFMARVRGLITRLFIRDHQIVDEHGEPVHGEIVHPNFDPVRGLSVRAAKTAASEPEETYFAHQDSGGVALIKRVLADDEATYFYLDHRTGQWVEDNSWAYINFAGSTSVTEIDAERAKEVAASLGAIITTADLAPEDQAYVDALQGMSFNEEQRVTPLLKSIAAQYGGDMRGLKFRVKGHVWEDGGFQPFGRTLAAKVERTMRAKGISAPRAAATVKDSLRYTVTFPEDHYAEGVEKVVSALRSMGNEPLPGNSRNYWKKGDPYDGINMVMTTSAGHRWELQFHTSKSFAAKMANHPLLEKFEGSHDPEERRHLYDQMADRMAKVPQPPHARDLGKGWMVDMFQPRPHVAALDDQWGLWADLREEPEPALPVTFSDDEDHDDPAMWAAAAKIAEGFAFQVRAGMYDGIPQDIPSFPDWYFENQAPQYPATGPDGITYFKGEIDADNHVDCLLYYKGGQLVGILNHFPKAMGPERKGNVLLLVHPGHQRQGIGSALWAEAKKRWNVKATGQDQTPEGKAFLDKHGSAGCSACSGSGEQGTGHECYICDGSGTASGEADGRAEGVTNDNPGNGLLVGRDDAIGQVPVEAHRVAPGEPLEHLHDDEATREYHDRIEHQTMPDGKRYPYDKPAYDRSLWGRNGPVMDSDDWKRLKHSSSSTGESYVFEGPDGKWWWEYHDEEYASGPYAGGGPFDTADQAWEASRHEFSPSARTDFPQGSKSLFGDDLWAYRQPPWEMWGGKTASVVEAADSEHAQALTEPKKVGDEWVIYAENGREVARSKDKKLLEDYRQQRVSALLAAAKITAALSQDDMLAMADKVADVFGMEEYGLSGADLLAKVQAKDERFDGVGLKQDDDGYYVQTHRARSDSYPTPEAIPQKDVDFIESTGSADPASMLAEHEARMALSAEGVAVSGKDPFAHLLAGSGDSSDVAAAAREFLAKTSLKAFSPAERAQIIDEGMDVQAANLDLLDIRGTHYEALDAALAKQDEDDSTYDGMMWL